MVPTTRNLTAPPTPLKIQGNLKIKMDKQTDGQKDKTMWLCSPPIALVGAIMSRVVKHLISLENRLFMSLFTHTQQRKHQSLYLSPHVHVFFAHGESTRLSTEHPVNWKRPPCDVIIMRIHSLIDYGSP